MVVLLVVDPDVLELVAALLDMEPVFISIKPASRSPAVSLSVILFIIFFNALILKYYLAVEYMYTPVRISRKMIIVSDHH